MTKLKFKLRLYHGRDGWRYTLKRSGRIIDAATQGYTRRDAAVANMLSKLLAYGEITNAGLIVLLRKRGRAVELVL